MVVEAVCCEYFGGVSGAEIVLVEEGVALVKRCWEGGKLGKQRASLVL
ncbi:MAG: hypothetical protein N2595_08815 [bacterium]|nr:hypothetical protein [bacterium]